MKLYWSIHRIQKGDHSSDPLFQLHTHPTTITIPGEALILHPAATSSQSGSMS